MKKYLIYVVVFFFFLLLFSLSIFRAFNQDPPVLTVGEITISEREFYERLKEQNGKDTLKQMLLDELLKEHFSVSEEEIDARLKHVEYGRETVARMLRLEKANRSLAEVSDEEIMEVYESTKDDVRASHILIDERTLADDIMLELEGGEDFGKLAKNHSLDEATKGNGGDMGYLSEEDVIEAFHVIFSLEKGEISDIIQTEFGFHILKVTEKDQTFSERKDEIKEQLISQKAKSADEILQILLRDKELEIYDGSLQ